MGRKAKKYVKIRKLKRSSSIEKTIDEGKDYINRADRKLRLTYNLNKKFDKLANKIKITKKKKDQSKRRSSPKHKPKKRVRAGPISILAAPKSNLPKIASENLIKTS